MPGDLNFEVKSRARTRGSYHGYGNPSTLVAVPRMLQALMKWMKVCSHFVQLS